MIPLIFSIEPVVVTVTLESIVKVAPLLVIPATTIDVVTIK